jgi:hypothetical protein
MSVHGLDKPSLLCLFIHGRHLPLDVRERLLEIVPRPAVPPLPTVAEIPAKVPTLVPPYTMGNRTGKAVKRSLAVYRSDDERRAVAELADVLRESPKTCARRRHAQKTPQRPQHVTFTAPRGPQRLRRVALRPLGSSAGRQRVALRPLGSSAGRQRVALRPLGSSAGRQRVALRPLGALGYGWSSIIGEQSSERGR